MTDVYDFVTRQTVAHGDPYVKVDLHYYEVPNCLPLTGPQVGERYTLRDGTRPEISVKCLTQGQPGLQTATFQEV